MVTAVPGPTGAAGAAGAAGADGDDGVAPWTVTTADFTMPAEGATVAVSVLNNSWAFVGQIVQVENAGWMQVTVVPGVPTSVTLRNIENTVAGTYPDNVAPGTVVADPVKIVPAGPTGPAGAATGAPAAGSFWTRVSEAGLSAESALGLLASGYVKVTTATGVPSTVVAVPLSDIDTTGYAIGNVLVCNGANRATVSPVDDQFIDYNAIAVAAFDIDWSLDRVFEKTLTAGAGADTFTFSNLVSKKTVTVILKQNATGTRTVAWPAGIYWSGGVAVAMTATANAYQTFSFYYNGTHTIAACVPDQHP